MSLLRPHEDGVCAKLIERYGDEDVDLVVQQIVKARRWLQHPDDQTCVYGVEERSPKTGSAYFARVAPHSTACLAFFQPALLVEM